MHLNVANRFGVQIVALNRLVVAFDAFVLFSS
jgi:hypothetical protein